jgi:hypothetical protein
MAILHLHRLNRILCLLAVLVLGSLTVAPAAYADTITVCPSGCEFTAIQPAIDSASSGDTIRIFSGVYQSEGGPIAVITDKSLVLEGVGATVLDCSELGVCEVMVQLSCSQNHQITIKGLTIQGGGLAHAGANLSNHGCKLRLIDSAVFDSEGLAIEHQGRGTLTIKNSEVSFGGISIAESKAFIINSTVTRSTSRYDAAIFNGGTLHLYHSTVSDNFGDQVSNTIFNRGTLIVKHSSIINNRAGEQAVGGGVGNSGVAIIEDSLIARNITITWPGGGGIYNGGKLTLIRSTVRDNSAPGGFSLPGLGGGIYNNAGARLRLIDTLVTRNFASDDGGGVFNDRGTVSQTRTLVINNTPNDCVGC